MERRAGRGASAVSPCDSTRVRCSRRQIVRTLKLVRNGIWKDGRHPGTSRRLGLGVTELRSRFPDIRASSQLATRDPGLFLVPVNGVVWG